MLRLEEAAASSSLRCISPRTTCWQIIVIKAQQWPSSWGHLALTPESSQNSTGIPPRASWWAASHSVAENYLPTATNHFRKWQNWHSTPYATDSQPFRTYFTSDYWCNLTIPNIDSLLELYILSLCCMLYFYVCLHMLQQITVPIKLENFYIICATPQNNFKFPLPCQLQQHFPITGKCELMHTKWTNNAFL